MPMWRRNAGSKFNLPLSKAQYRIVIALSSRGISRGNAYRQYVQLQTRVKSVVSDRCHAPPVFSTTKMPPLPQELPHFLTTDTNALVCAWSRHAEVLAAAEASSWLR